MAGISPYGPEYGFGLYIHWPYCTRICPYCDFNVYAAKARDTGPLGAALLDDLAHHRRLLPDHPALGSIYFGGGTPSLMNPEQIGTLIEQADSLFGLEAGAEITLEANPVDITPARLISWKAAGVNRLSLGVQSLDDEALTFLGRDHDSRTARHAVNETLSVFDNVSIDLIYARPGQSEESWQTELTDALNLGAPHLSLYELTIEARTAFGKRAARGALVPMPDDDQADLYELTQDVCNRLGLPAYEVSNHAATNTAKSQHNLTYWRGGDWIGIGPGAHGRLSMRGQRYATLGPLKPAAYVEASTDIRPRSWEALASLDAARELLALGLRPDTGFDLERVSQLTGISVSQTTVDHFASSGLVAVNGSTIKLTPSGRLLADRIAAELSP